MADDPGLYVRLKPALMDELDRRRGETSRAEFVRGVLVRELETKRSCHSDGIVPDVRRVEVKGG